MTRSFALSIKPTRVERAAEATANMGSAVSTSSFRTQSYMKGFKATKFRNTANDSFFLLLIQRCLLVLQ